MEQQISISIKKPETFKECFTALYRFIDDGGEKTLLHQNINAEFNPPKDLSTIRNWCQGNIPQTNQLLIETIMAEEISYMIQKKIETQKDSITSMEEMLLTLIEISKKKIPNIENLDYEQ